MRLYWVLISLFSVTGIFAQDAAHGPFDDYALRYNADELKKTNYIGTPFLNDEWRRAEVIIQGDTIQYREAKFNIEKDIMEIKSRGEDFYIRGSNISQFRWKGYEGEGTSYYRPNVSLVHSDKEIKELLRTTVFDDFKIMSTYWVLIRSPSRETPQLGGSVNEGRIIIQRRHFILQDSELFTIKRPKDLSKHFNVEERKIKKIIKSKKRNIDRHEDLVTLIDQIQS
ncbi:MAG: hypothetical protein ACI9FN_001215 [Saprospiraceae bacterium]|jgi:hypothetical protein